jgi:excisionase family DNA binding protein
MELTNADRPIAVTVARAANMLGCSRWSIRQYAKTGELRVARLGRRKIMVPVASLEQFIQEATEKAR